MQEILQVANGRNKEAVQRLNWIHSLMQPQPGFVGAQVSQYLGNSMRHLILRMWEDKEAFTGLPSYSRGVRLLQGPPARPLRGATLRP